MKIPCGIRNNNPANIRRGSSWKGLVPFLIDPLSKQRYYDKAFCQFSDMKFGVRALFVLLRTYHYKYKLHTISCIIHRFAPLSENNTYAYIAYVVKIMRKLYSEVNLSGNDVQYFTITYNDLNSETFLCLFSNPQTPTFACRCLAKAICLQECGYDLSDGMIDDALKYL